MSLAGAFKLLGKYVGKIINSIESGAERRRAAAGIAVLYDEKGGETAAAEISGMSRNTIRKGMRELESGEFIEDNFSARGRDRCTKTFPKLEEHIKAIYDSQSTSQADPTLKTDQIYTNMSVAELRNQLIAQYGYDPEKLPCVRTLSSLSNELGYTVRSVKKSQPKAKIPETDAIFEKLNEEHDKANKDDTVIRLSLDAKATVGLGPYSRCGKTRANVDAQDHDYIDNHVTPFGIFNVKDKTTALYFTKSKITADFIVDMLEDYWLTYIADGEKHELVLNCDNGPECNSSRTQFMNRIFDFSIKYDVTIRLAYYPPYHSKYNPIERVWGVLEQHWGGSLLLNVDYAINFAKSMTYAGNHPDVKLIETEYETGVRLSKKEMNVLNTAFQREPGLEKYFVTIEPSKSMEVMPKLSKLR
jgi:predicted ArsR family transcriptional regulator